MFVTPVEVSIVALMSRKLVYLFVTNGGDTAVICRGFQGCLRRQTCNVFCDLFKQKTLSRFIALESFCDVMRDWIC